MRGYQTQEESRGEALEASVNELAAVIEDARALKRELEIVRTLANEHRRANRELSNMLTRIPELEREVEILLSALGMIAESDDPAFMRLHARAAVGRVKR
jgi:hypothetical protein